MNEQIQKYLDVCDQKFNELEKANKEKAEIVIPQKTEFIDNKNEMDFIKKYLYQKDDLLKTALVTLFKNNSVIVEGVMSVRNEQFRRYRCQDELGLQDVKETIYDYCNYLKLTSDELEVLDFCLKLVNYEDYDDYRGLRKINDRWERKTHKLKKSIYVFDEEDSEFKTLKRIELFPNGDIKFKDDEEKRRYSYNDSLNDEQIAMLTYHYQDEIKSMKDSFDKELKDMRIKLEQEIKEIREKCGKYLLVASLKESGK